MRYAAWIVAAALCSVTALADDLPENIGEIESLTTEQAKALAQHEFKSLVLYGLTTLSDEAADALRANRHISLPDQFKH